MLKRESDELKRNGISLVKKIGSGSFSGVFCGRWKVDEQAKNVALKSKKLLNIIGAMVKSIKFKINPLHPKSLTNQICN